MSRKRKMFPFAPKWTVGYDKLRYVFEKSTDKTCSMRKDLTLVLSFYFMNKIKLNGKSLEKGLICSQASPVIFKFIVLVQLYALHIANKLKNLQV